MKKSFTLFLLAFLLLIAFGTSKTRAESGYTLIENQRIDVSLFYSPKNPFNNPDNPMEITISSHVLASKSSDDLEYTWRVYGSTEKKDPSDWEEILKKDIPNVSDMSGYGLNKLKFKLAFKDEDLRYIRVKLNIQEKTDSGRTNKREASIVIPLNSVLNELSVYSVSAQSDSPEKKNLEMKDVICENKEGVPCYVPKGEIVGLKMDSSNLSDFLWKIDGEQIEYLECPLEKCNANEAFLPILKNDQETYDIAISATVKSTGKRVTFNRELIVSEPKAVIESLDKTTCAPILLGYFKDLDDNLTPDYSTTDFEAIAGSTVKLTPNVKIKDVNNISWTIDETEINKESSSLYGLVIENKEYGVVINDDGTISFPADTQEGYSFDVTFSTFYTPNNATKKALQKYWGLSLYDFYEKQLDATINISIVNALSSSDQDLGDSSSESKKKTGLAALISNAPSHLVYLVKLVLISFLLLFSSYFFLSLFPKK